MSTKIHATGRYPVPARWRGSSPVGQRHHPVAFAAVMADLRIDRPDAAAARVDARRYSTTAYTTRNIVKRTLYKLRHQSGRNPLRQRDSV